MTSFGVSLLIRGYTFEDTRHVRHWAKNRDVGWLLLGQLMKGQLVLSSKKGCVCAFFKVISWFLGFYMCPNLLLTAVEQFKSHFSSVLNAFVWQVLC